MGVSGGESARDSHDFGSYVLGKTGNLKAVMDAMGHADVKSAMTVSAPGAGNCARSDQFTAHFTAHPGNHQLVSD